MKVFVRVTPGLNEQAFAEMGQFEFRTFWLSDQMALLGHHLLFVQM